MMAVDGHPRERVHLEVDEIIPQIAAARTALEQVGFTLLDRRVERCIADALASGDERAVDIQTSEMLTAVQRVVRMS